jgi:hypothetical protein
MIELGARRKIRRIATITFLLEGVWLGSVIWRGSETLYRTKSPLSVICWLLAMLATPWALKPPR